MHSSIVIAHFFIFASFFVRNTNPHAAMKYPPIRATLRDGVPHVDSNIDPILPKGTPLYFEGHVVYKSFPCGSSQPRRNNFNLEKGKILPVQITVNNWHYGGTCQFSISYDNAKTFVAFHQVLHDCLNTGGTSREVKIDVPIPNDLPGGNAVFAWTWITKKSNQPE
ncbi:hypothetical protein HMI55_000325, partial [Coelomomyces lativittatus]